MCFITLSHMQQTVITMSHMQQTVTHTTTHSPCHLCCCYFGQGSSLLWTHTPRPLYNRPIALTQEGRSQVDDVCGCVHD